MKTQSCKAKGRRLQQQVRDKILSCFDHLTLDDVRSTSMGAGGEDVQLSTEARKCVPFSFECKNVEKLNVWCAVDQAKENCPPGSDPVLIMKKNGRDAHALLHMDVFFDLVQSMRKSVRKERKTPSPRVEGNRKEIDKTSKEEKRKEMKDLLVRMTRLVEDIDVLE